MHTVNRVVDSLSWRELHRQCLCRLYQESLSRNLDESIWNFLQWKWGEIWHLRGRESVHVKSPHSYYLSWRIVSLRVLQRQRDRDCKEWVGCVRIFHHNIRGLMIGLSGCEEEVTVNFLPLLSEAYWEPDARTGRTLEIALCSSGRLYDIRNFVNYLLQSRAWTEGCRRYS